jgi:VanZ family protein
LPTTSTKRLGTGSRARKPFAGILIRALWILFGLAGVVAFAMLITKLTLSPDPGAGRFVHDNTHPGETLRLYLDRPSVKAAVLEVGGNFVLLAPLGVLLPILSERFHGVWRIFLIIGVISLAIETAQGTVIAGRAFDADDVILNTLGGVAAYLLFGRRIARWAHVSRRS